MTRCKLGPAAWAVCLILSACTAPTTDRTATQAEGPFGRLPELPPPTPSKPTPSKPVPPTPVKPPAPTPAECRWAQGPIKLDGSDDEPAWKAAQELTFRKPWAKTGQDVPRSAATAKLLWNRDHLYFFARMQDADLYADIKEHDGRTWENDVFELFFKPSTTEPGYYEFQVSPAGTRMDMFLPRRGAGGYDRFKADGEFHIEAKVKLDGTLNNWGDKDKGWTVEGRIPWTDFLRAGGRPAPGGEWTFTLCRYDYSVEFEGPELSSTAPLTRTDFHRYEDYQALRFVGPPATSAIQPYGVDKLLPVTTSNVIGSPEPPAPYRMKRVYPKLKLDFPIAIEHQPGSDRMLAIVQPRSYGTATLIRFRDDPEVTEYEVLRKFDTAAYTICFHPKFAENGYVYLGCNEKKKSRVIRHTIDRKPPYAFDEKSATVILEWPSDGHNGAALAFGNDGMLYITSGDGTSDSDTDLMGQGLDHLLSKVLRIDVDRPDAGKTYSIPKDNPFLKTPGARPETYAYGLRNPWRMTCDPKTGHIWVGNNGQDIWEQIYFVKPGDNYGWSVMEGSYEFYPTRKAGPNPFVKPALEHHHSEARSLTGGVVYYGPGLPELHGVYVYGDHSTGKIWGARHDGTKVTWHQELVDTAFNITAFGADPRGEVLVADHRGDGKGGFYVFERNPPSTEPSKFPRTLSASGLFASVAGHKMQPSLIPYSVNAALWSDGAHKERWLALAKNADGSDPVYDITGTRGWNLPDRTVLVKSFALDLVEGDPKSRKWIETRFLVKQQSEWVGYTYLWNDEQTEGTLVDSKGLDREYTIKTATGDRKQKWHLPSRAECMVCHSRAANFVLGINAYQLNGNHDYGNGVVDNQLRTWEHLGLLKADWLRDALADVRSVAEKQGLSKKEVDEYVRVRSANRLQKVTGGSLNLLPRQPERLPKLVDPYDAKADLDARARSYLHVNCATCHVPAGGGNAAMDLEFTQPPEKRNLIDVKPLHHTFGIPDARIIAPGDPNRSVLLKRMSMRDRGHMPPLATAIVDEAAVKLIREWIAAMPK